MLEDWISAEEMRAEIGRSGATISDRRLERWRREGLLPRTQRIGRGRGRGFHFKVPQDSAAQAIEIDRLYAIREKREWVGWQLWMRGYWVDDQYWRPAIEHARATIIEVAREARRYERKAQSKPVDLDKLRASVRSGAQETPFAGTVALIDPPMIETVLGIAIEIVNGNFEGFSSQSAEASQDRRAMLTLIRARNIDRHSVAGQMLALATVIDPILIQLSKALRRLSRRNSTAEPPILIRNELAQIFETGKSLNEMGLPVFGRSAFGLGLFSTIAELSAISVHATMLLIWVELRKRSPLFLSTTAIQELHLDAIAASELAAQFWIFFQCSTERERVQLQSELKRVFVTRKETNRLTKIGQ